MILALIVAVSLPVFDFATNSIAQRIAGADPAVCLSRFDDYPPSKGKMGFPRCLWEKPFQMNEKFWLNDVDFSCASPWNDSCGAARAGTLISKRHIIFASHFPLWKGVRILFVDQTGEVCPCRIEATKSVEDSDITIGLLDYEVAHSIHPAKILPDDFARYIGNGNGLPVVTFNQNEEVFLTELNSISTNRVELWQCSRQPTRKDHAAFRKPLVGGDSGNPAFLLIGKEPVLLYCLKNGNCGGGPSIFRRRKAIQKAMDELCPGYKLEEFDFSKVPRGK